MPIAAFVDRAVGDALGAPFGLGSEPKEGPSTRDSPPAGWDTDLMARDEERRSRAVKRLEERREFSTHVVTYVVVNAFLIGIWAFSGGGYFWPVWVLFGWGIGLAMHAWKIFGEKPITEADIEQEMRREQDEPLTDRSSTEAD